MFNRETRYNKKSSKKLGWRPTWFGVEGFEDILTVAIMAFQEEHELVTDGLCGPTTYRRILAQYESNISPLKPHIIVGGNVVQIPWAKTVSLTMNGNMSLPKSCYSSRKTRKDPTQVVTHFDVCLSAASCKRVLEKKGISSHFVIDNDGTIYQMVDPAYTAWHAGNRGANKRSVGIDISNAYYVKYNKTYKKRTHFLRPILRNIKVHGVNIKKCLGFYDVQLEAYKVLVKTLCEFYDIPQECPVDDTGKLIRKVSKDAKTGKFKGVVCHYHLTRGKIDCVNLELEKIMEEVRAS
jgi:hypothetical protein